MPLLITTSIPELSFNAAWLYAFIVLTARYFMFAGLAFFIINYWFKNSLLNKKIQAKNVSVKVMYREILSSMSSFIILGACMALVIVYMQRGQTKIYTEGQDANLFYTVTSFIVLLIIHDTYFYWIHRMMHLPILFKYVHAHHHKSKTPTPWTAFSFHPLEAILEVAFIVPLVFIMPIHLYVLMAFAVVMTAMNVFGHLGYELFPEKFLLNRIGKAFNSTTNHDKHHRFSNCNYGLYFNFWDNIMQTKSKL